MVDVKKTITSIFIVPTLKINKELLMDNGFVNGYIKDENKELNYENSVCVLFKPDNLDKFRTFLDGEYERTKSIIEDYDYEGGYVVVVYQLDKNFRNDFTLIKKGLYSKTSPEFQKLFPKIIKIKKDGMQKDEVSLQYMIFNRTPLLIEFWENKLGVTFDDQQEIWHAFILENETLNINKILENVE
jgi:hypothetical protein